MAQNFDFIVVGQGVMGLATTYALSKKGFKVLGLDQYSLFHQKGSSHGESRIIRMAYFEDPGYIPLLKLAYQGWAELEKQTGVEIFKKSGVAFFTQPDSSVIYKGVKESARLFHIPIEEFSSEEARKKFPFFRAPKNFNLLYEANAGYLLVDKALRSFAEGAKTKGALIHENEKVLSWTEKQSIEVVTDRASYTCSKLIFAGGAWTSKLLQELNIPLKICRAIQYWFEVSDPSATSYPCYGFHLPEDFYYGFPSLDGKTIKFAAHFGIDPIAHPEEKDISSIPKVKLESIRKFVNSCLPNVSNNCAHYSTCIYTMTPDEHFIIDFHPSSKNILMACGFSGHGFKFAPAIGEILSDLSTTASHQHAINFLRLNRFKLNQ